MTKIKLSLRVYSTITEQLTFALSESQKKEEEKNGLKNYPKMIMAKNSPDLVKGKILQIREVWEPHTE